MTAGIFSTSALAVSPADIELPRHAAVYVGAGTCYTCHTDEFDGWSVPLDLQAMADAAVKPKQVVAAVAAREEVEHIDIDETATCLSAKNGAQLAGSESRQYVVKTDTGESLLPLQWNEDEPDVAVPDQRSAAIDCTVRNSGFGASGTLLIARADAPRLNRPRLPSVEISRSSREVTTLLLPSETAFMEGQSA